MKTLPLELRKQILASYDRGVGTRQDVADRYRVSLAMIKKLLQQRRHTGDIGPRHHLAGRKPTILPAHRRRFRTLLARRPNMTLRELREAVGLQCSLPAIHYVLADMGLTYRERRRQATSNKADK
jgi:transposase